MDPLEPFIGVRIKVRCGRCRNVLDVLAPATDPWHAAPGHGEVLRQLGDGLASWADGSPGGRGQWSRAAVAVESATLGQGDSTPARWTWTCNYRRCVKHGGGRPARYTVTGARIEERFLRAARAGAADFTLGQ